MMTNAERISWWNTFHKFQQSRESAWSPKLTTALNNQIKAVTSFLKEHGIEATISNLTAIIPMNEIAVIIKNIYLDAGKVFGGKAYQMVKQTQVKQLMPIGYNEELVNEIIAYFQAHLLNEAVLPITETTRDYCLRILTRSQQTGVSINDIVDELQNTELTRNRARMIARTETSKASNFGAVQSVKKLGYDTMKIWISGQDLRTRRIPRDEADHLHANGMKTPINEPFRIRDRKNGGFVNMMQPGDPNGGAENVVNCRCTVGFEILDNIAAKPKPIKPPAPIEPEPIRQGFYPAKTVDEAKQWAKDNLGIKSHEANLSVEALNTVHKRLFELKTEYKADNLKNLTEHAKSYYASASTVTMNFNAKYFDNPDTFVKSLKKDVASGWHPKDTDSIQAVIDHEFAHVLTIGDILFKQGSYGQLSKLKSEYTRAINKEAKQGINPTDSKLFISRYGQKNLDEFTAEGFAMALNSTNPSPFAIRIKEIIDKWHKK